MAPTGGDRPAGATRPTEGGGAGADGGADVGDAEADAAPERPLDELALDALLVAAVPAVLVGVHYAVPADVRVRLALRHGAPTPATFLTSAYVHGSDAHLLGNLAGYAIGALYAYGLCLQARRRPWFRRTFLALVLLLPLPVNAASLAAFSLRYPGVEPVSRGFSGVVAGFAGFVLVALVGFLRSRHGARVARSVGAAVVLLLLLQVDYVYAGRFRVPTVALVLAGLLVLGHGLIGSRPVAPTLRDGLRSAPGDWVVVGLVAVVLAVLVANLFPSPSTLVTGSGFTDVFAHAAGVVGGAVVAAVLGRVTRDNGK
ncbi:MAG: hypothetical protein ABEH47_03985 [Haloferacaceae archaeon]